MNGYEPEPGGRNDFQPPEEVSLGSDLWLSLSPIGSSHTIDIRHLPRPLDTIEDTPDEVIADQERVLRDEYIAMCEATFGAIWHETEMFIATTSIDEVAELNDSTIFDTHLAFDELIQNAFRHGGRPRQIWISLVNATDYHAQEAQPSRRGSVQLQDLQGSQIATISGNRVLLGIQDASPNWNKATPANNDLPVNLRGLDIVRGVSKAVWYETNRSTSKWVWTLI